MPDTPSLTSPVVDYEPPPVGACPAPTPARLRRRTARPLAPRRAPVREAPPPRAAAVFTEAALRRVLEVLDRRRPPAQLRNVLRPNLVDVVTALSRAAVPARGSAVLGHVRLRAVDAGAAEPRAAEVFATFTRAGRIRAIAGRVELVSGRWQVVALQIG